MLIFLVTNALPGSVANVLLGTQAAPGEVAALEERLGLNRPLAVRYFEWIGGVLQGNFGNTMIGDRDVLGEILPKLGISAWLITLGMAVALLIAVPLGSFAALRRRRASGFVASALSQLGLSIPAFWAGIWLVIIFAVHLRILPAGGYVPLRKNPAAWAAHLVLPVISLALVQGSLLARYVRSAVIEVTNEDWYRTARAVGWSRLGALRRPSSSGQYWSSTSWSMRSTTSLTRGLLRRDLAHDAPLEPDLRRGASGLCAYGWPDRHVLDSISTDCHHGRA